jgi:hypothetical protein
MTASRPVDPSDTNAVRRAVAARLIAAGWRFRRGSTAPWIPPDSPPPRAQGPGMPAGYSLLGAAERQAEIEGRAEGMEERAFGRHAA